MTTRRTFIKTMAAVPPLMSFGSGWAANDPSRLALIIGNSAYRDSPLINPVNDARAVIGLFTEAGFTVDSRLNATRVDMMGAIERFGTMIKRPETKLVAFYYAGHGAQLEWHNYLLPIDAVVERQEDMKQSCVDLNLLLGQLSQAKNKTFVVILDACRNNPFGQSYRPEQKGLSQFDAPVGSLLAYATSPGNVASDGEGVNGLYTENLVRELSRRGTRIEDALKRVRLNVRLASHGEQIPWETTSLETDVFIFNDDQKRLTEAEQEELLEADFAEWGRIKSSKKVDDWVGYLRTFPNGRFAEIAQARLTRLLADVEKQRLEREQQEAAKAERLAAEKRQQEEMKRLELERIERKQREEQQLQELRQRQEEQKTIEGKRRLEQEHLERQRAAEVERQAVERQRLEDDRRRVEQEGPAVPEPTPIQVVSPASVQPISAAIPTHDTQILVLGEGSPVPMLIAPSDNPYSAGRYPLGRIYTVGDYASFRQTDILTGLEEKNYWKHVRQVDYEEDQVVLGPGYEVLDLMGNVITIGRYKFDNPLQWTPTEFQIGKKWTAAYRLNNNGVVSVGFYEMQIAKRETVTVPAGSFDSFRIEGTGWDRTFGNHLEVKLWMVPGVNFSIKTERMERSRWGRLYVTAKTELASLRQHVFDTRCAAPGADLKRTLTIRSGCV